MTGGRQGRLAAPDSRFRGGKLLMLGFAALPPNGDGEPCAAPDDEGRPACHSATTLRFAQNDNRMRCSR